MEEFNWVNLIGLLVTLLVAAVPNVLRAIDKAKQGKKDEAFAIALQVVEDVATAALSNQERRSVALKLLRSKLPQPVEAVVTEGDLEYMIEKAWHLYVKPRKLASGDIAPKTP